MKLSFYTNRELLKHLRIIKTIMLAVLSVNAPPKTKHSVNFDLHDKWSNTSPSQRLDRPQVNTGPVCYSLLLVSVCPERPGLLLVPVCPDRPDYC